MKRKPCWVVVCLLTTLALCDRGWAQQPEDNKSAVNPLVRVLQAKGILTAEEVAQISQASSAGDADRRLAKLLLMKGVISQADYDQTVGAPAVINASTAATSSPTVVAAVYRVPINNGANAVGSSNAPPAASPYADPKAAVFRGTSESNASIFGVSTAKKMSDILPSDIGATTDIAFGTIEAGPEPPAGGPEVVPAFAPVRVLPVGLMTRESVKPVISTGPIHIQPYGFFKMNIIEDSSMPTGGDAPLSGMLVANTGPNANPEFHLNARSSRFGSNFEWLDASEKLVITGKVEGDFEGNFTHSQNRNISSVRSSTFGIRLAYGRLDYHATDSFGVFGEFGQNWTLFCSSTLSSSNETTLLGVEFGTCYERQMQARFGMNYDLGGDRHFQIQPEFALAYPALGQAADTTLGAISGQLSIGERSGADSNRPEYQSRVALQFQLDKAPGVAPAQLIVSGVYGKAKEIVASTAVPVAFAGDFPGGASTAFHTYGYSLEAQLPTRWLTFQAKWWAGGALRWFFVDNLLNSFNPTASFLAANPGGVVSAPITTISAEGAGLVFGCSVPLVAGACPAASASVLPQLPIRGAGGFGDLGIPLSRIFGANPKGRNAGWTLDLGYNIDQSRAHDLRQNFGAAGGRYKNDWSRATLNYKINSWVLIGFEEGYYRTRAIPAPCAPTCSATNPFGSPLTIDGRGVRSWHDLHSQISTVFFF
jgi:hypothetical protein